MKLLFLSCALISINCSFAQSKNDPVSLRDDGLPAVSPRDADVEDSDRTSDEYQPTRQHIPGTINRTDEQEQQPLEYNSAYETEEQEKHFVNDTTRVPLKNPSGPKRAEPRAAPDTSGTGKVNK